MLEKQFEIITANIFMVLIGVGYFVNDILCTLGSTGYHIVFIFISMNTLGGTRFITRSIFVVSTNPIEYFGTILATFATSQIFVALTTSLWSNLTVNSLNGNYGTINWIMASFSFISCIFPIIIFILRHKYNFGKIKKYRTFYIKRHAL